MLLCHLLIKREERAFRMRMSKIFSYENPYSVTGTICLDGSEEKPKYICKDKSMGTFDVSHMEN